MKPTRPTLGPRLPRYVLAAGAVAAAGAAPLVGQIVHFNNTNAFTGTHNWDIDNNGSMDFHVHFVNSHISTFSHIDYLWIAGYGTGPFPNPNFNFNKLAAQDSNHLLPVAPGGVIGSGLNFLGAFNLLQYVTNNDAVVPQITAGTQFLGFRFLIAGDGVHYGWASVTIDPGAATTISVNEWAYNSVAGASIQAGQTAIPEPAAAGGGLGLLALGAAGVARYKRNKLAA